MKFAETKTSYFDRYDNEMYANDADHQNLLQLLRDAEALTDAAKAEFVKAFNFDYALDGMIKASPRRYPTLVSEAPAAGMKLA